MVGVVVLTWTEHRADDESSTDSSGLSMTDSEQPPRPAKAPQDGRLEAGSKSSMEFMKWFFVNHYFLESEQ